jgi:hypothetical protein
MPFFGYDRMSQFVGQCKQRIARYEFLGFLTIFRKQATFKLRIVLSCACVAASILALKDLCQERAIVRETGSTPDISPKGI